MSAPSLTTIRDNALTELNTLMSQLQSYTIKERTAVRQKIIDLRETVDWCNRQIAAQDSTVSYTAAVEFGEPV